MASEDKFQGSSSQESLPLSQGSFSVLMSQLQPYLLTLPDNVNEQANFGSEVLPPESHSSFSQLCSPLPYNFGQFPVLSSPILHADLLREPSSLPGSENWPGLFSFQLFFPQQETTKGATWLYWELKNKLYVAKDSPCPFNFSTSTAVPGDDIHIRATALFSSPDHASDIVHRCINHSMEETRKGMVEAEHLIRCESKMSYYEVNPITGRHSVVVPFENPPVGQKFSTYIYKFACFGSCAGGPNRRPMILVFTLEKGTQVIGRCKVDLKVCACPRRDKKQDEKQLLPQGVKSEVLTKESEPIKRKEPAVEGLGFMPDLIPTKKSRPSSPASEDGYYIRVQDKACYKFLKQMKHLYYMCCKMQSKSSKLSAYLAITSSEDEQNS